MSENYYSKGANPVPAVWQCAEEGCSEFATAVAPAAEAGSFIRNRIYCAAHATKPYGYKSLTFDLAGSPVETDIPYPPAGDSRRIFIKNLHTGVGMLNLEKIARQKAERDLTSFKETVVQTTVEYDGGCKEGKKDFLESLGLDYPKVNVRITATFEYDGDIDDISSYDLEYGIAGCLSGESSNIYVEVEEDA